jgi:AcrR family transcriptional regulator
MISQLRLPDPQPDDIPVPFDLVDVLARRLPRLRNRPKRARTRALVLWATARELAECGYAGLTVNGICGRAGLARGTFYLYFPHRSDAAVHVYRLFWRLLVRGRPRLPGATATARVKAMNRHYLHSYRVNARFLEGQNALARERPDFAADRDRLNHAWSLRVARYLPRTIDGPGRILRARALAGLVDELMREIHHNASPTLAQWRDSPDALAEHVSAIWLSVLQQDATP